MMAWSSSRCVLVIISSGLFVAGCGEAAPRVGLVNNEQPISEGAPEGLENSRDARHVHTPGKDHSLPNDLDSLEPEHPMAATRQERALVHIHAPGGLVCSGVVLGPRVIGTAQQCLKGEQQGVTTLGAGHDYRVEVASSALTWTNRKAKYAVVPQCGWDDVDIGLLVLDEQVAVEPLKIASAPGTGGKVQALGFGRCDGQKSMVDRMGTVSSRVSDDVVIDIPLCKGDTGGPVVDNAGGDVIGIISHRDDPEGSPLRTTTISRLDTRPARKLLDQATKLAEGGDVASAKPIACR